MKHEIKKSLHQADFLNKNKDLVSIIIPVYNAEKFLPYTINSALNQTYKNFEIILINDCSNDNSINIIKKYKDKRIKLLNNTKNLKVAKTRNNGIKTAKGRYICFLDADDIWYKNKLEKQIKFMKKTKCEFSFTSYEFANEDGKPNGKKVLVPKKINYSEALKNTTIFTSTVMFDMKKLEKKDIYMPNIKSEDTATWWNILKKIDYGYGLNEVLTLYRRSNGTLSSNKFEAIKRIWYLYRKHEKLNIIKSSYNFVNYAINALKRRI